MCFYKHGIWLARAAALLKVYKTTRGGSLKMAKSSYYLEMIHKKEEGEGAETDFGDKMPKHFCKAAENPNEKDRLWQKGRSRRTAEGTRSSHRRLQQPASLATPVSGARGSANLRCPAGLSQGGFTLQASFRAGKG